MTIPQQTPGGKRNTPPSRSMTSSSSDSSSESPSDSSSEPDDGRTSPNTKRVKKARKSSRKREKKRAKRDEHQITAEHEMGKVGLALQQHQYLISNALQEQSNRILQQQSTLEEISKMLAETKEKEDRKRDKIAMDKNRDELRRRIGKGFESRFHQRKYDKSLSVQENVARSKAQSLERKEAYWGINDHRELTVVRRDLNRKHQIEDELASLKASAEAGKPHISNKAKRKLRQSREQKRDKALGAIPSPGEKDESSSVAESAPERDERLRLQDENFLLVCEIRKLELRKSKRWNQLVALNKWENHEEDAVVKELDYDIEQLSLKQLKVWSLLQESNAKWDRLMKMVESEISPAMGKAAETKLDDEELDYLFLLKVKKGEDKVFVQFLLKEDKAEWEGPFALDLTSTCLIQHSDLVHPNKDEWKLKNQREHSSPSKKDKGQPYQGFKKGVRGDVKQCWVYRLGAKAGPH